MAKRKPDILQGTLDMLILRTLAVAPSHGWGVAKRIRERSRDVLRINQGSLYPALYRLQDRGLIRSQVGESGDGRPVKIYSLTAKGKRQLQLEQESWSTLSQAVDFVMQEA